MAVIDSISAVVLDLESRVGRICGFVEAGRVARGRVCSAITATGLFVIASFALQRLGVVPILASPIAPEVMRSCIAALRERPHTWSAGTTGISGGGR